MIYNSSRLHTSSGICSSSHIIFIIFSHFIFTDSIILTMSTAATAASACHANAYEILGTPRLRISTQIAQALLVTPPLNPTIDDLLHIVVGSREFVLETQLSRRRGRGRSSWIRNHGEFLVEVTQSRAGASFWSCRRCDAKGSPRLFGAAATSTPQEHLLRYVSVSCLSI